MSVDRIDAAWTQCRDWITEYDGSVTETYFVDIKARNLICTLDAIQCSSVSFSLAPLWGKEERAARLSVADMVRLLDSGELANCAVDYVTVEPGFELQVRLIVDRTDSGLFDADAVWWADHVFPKDKDHFKRFRNLLAYFLALQDSFGSKRLFIGPENNEDPRNTPSWWTEI